MEKIYYLDNAATTKIFAEEFDLMKSQNEEGFYNPSASYTVARSVNEKLRNARSVITKALRGNEGKLIFTSSATESNNMVFEGVHLRVGDSVLISKGEHPAVYNSAHRLSQKGINIFECPLSLDGTVDFEEFKNFDFTKIKLVSVMHVSNETGAINDIKKLCEYAKSKNKNILFHSDGVQAFGKIKVNLQNLGVDFYTISAHKIYAPRGIAGLWKRNGVICDALLVGGGQEDGDRSSTENVDGSIAFAYAVQKVTSELNENYEKVSQLKKELLEKLLDSSISEYIKVNSNENCSPYIVSLSFKDIKGENVVNELDKFGIIVSTGSACSAKKSGNRTLESMNVSKNEVIGSLRISFSPYMDYDIDYIAEKIISVVMRFEKNNLKDTLWKKLY